jgi:deoxycytidine triphosphate deaminase
MGMYYRRPNEQGLFPCQLADAAARAQRYAHDDPLPSVQRSLLSSAEIYDYVRLTGMIHPFSRKALKSASYEAHVGGQCIWWDEHGQKQEQQITRGDRLVLQANSIKFVQAEPTFRLPYYIAVRFNLRITHVHRGLLLGTGPLVDPGFEGKLFIPLHNLTSSDYDLNTNEALIWIEFTKTTHGVIPTEEVASTSRLFVEFPIDRLFVEFPIDKKNLTPNQYLYKANLGRPIRSSIPEAIAQGQKAATDAAASVKQVQHFFEGVGFVAILVLAVALYLQVNSLIQNSITLSTSVNQTLAGASADGKANADKLGEFQSQFEKFRQGLAADVKANADKFAASRGQIERLEQRLEQLSRDVEALKSQPQAPRGRAGRR